MEFRERKTCLSHDLIFFAVTQIIKKATWVMGTRENKSQELNSDKRGENFVLLLDSSEQSKYPDLVFNVREFENH